MVFTIIHTQFIYLFIFSALSSRQGLVIGNWFVEQKPWWFVHTLQYIWAFLPNQSIGKIRWQLCLLQSHDLPSCLPLCSLHTTGVTVSHADKRDCSLFILFSPVINVFVFIHAGWNVRVCKDMHRFFMWNEDSYCSDWGILLPSIEPQRRSLLSFL